MGADITAKRQVCRDGHTVPNGNRGAGNGEQGTESENPGMSARESCIPGCALVPSPKSLLRYDPRIGWTQKVPAFAGSAYFTVIVRHAGSASSVSGAAFV